MCTVKKMCRDATHLKQALRRAENYMTKNVVFFTEKIIMKWSK